MKVLILNGSPHKNGSTAYALGLVEKALNRCGIETEWIHVPADTQGCIGCWKCQQLGRCIFDDGVNEAAEKMRAADGLIIGSPVYFASASGSLFSFLDRMFASSHGFGGKPAAVVAVARRAGASATLDALAKYPTIAEMPLVTSCYWPMIYGNTPEQSKTDAEGAHVMERLGQNMAWLLRCIELGKAQGVVREDFMEK